MVLSVAIIYSGLLARVNGTSERVLQIAENLSNEGAQVTLSGFVEDDSKATGLSDTRIILIPSKKTRFLGIIKWFIKMVESIPNGKYDVVQIESFPFFRTLILFLMFQPFSKKFVIVHHDNLFKTDPRNTIRGYFQISLQKLLFVLFDAVITPGKTAKTWFVGFHGKIAENKIVVIPNGTPRLIKKYDKTYLIKKYRLPGNSLSVLFFGSMKFEPNFASAMRLYEISEHVSISFEKINGVRINFFVAGFGSETLPKSEFFTPLGFIKDLNEMLSISDVVVLPQTISHSGPHVKTLYAFLSGIPVVATLDAVKDLQSVTNNNHFLLFSLNEPESLIQALTSLYKDKLLGQRISDNALHYAERYSWSNIAKLHLILYRKLLG
jgi:glycosyltransferase involved in cell wall biosynthesis